MITSSRMVIVLAATLNLIVSCGLAGIAIWKSDGTGEVIACVISMAIISVAATLGTGLVVLSREKSCYEGFSMALYGISILQFDQTCDEWNNFVAAQLIPSEMEDMAKAMCDAITQLRKISRFIPRRSNSASTAGGGKTSVARGYSSSGDIHGMLAAEGWDSYVGIVATPPDQKSLDKDTIRSSQSDLEESDDPETSTIADSSCQKSDFDASESNPGTISSSHSSPQKSTSMRGLTAVIAAKNAFLRPGKASNELVCRRVVTEAILNTKGFNDFSKSYELDTVMKFHSKWIEACTADAKSCAAVVERFVGDEIHVNFGGLVPCSVPGQKAGRWLLKVRERLDAMHIAFKNEHRDTDSPLHLPATYMGAAQGPAICGTLGTDALKGSAVLGRIVGGAKALQAVARDTGFDIIVDRRIADECQGHITSVAVDVIQVGVDGSPQEVCYLVGRSGTVESQDEWLYSLAVDGNYDKAWKVLRAGDVALACEMMATYVHQSKNHTAALVCARVQRFVAEVKKATGELPKEYCRTVRIMTFTPRPLLSRIPRASIAPTNFILPVPRAPGMQLRKEARRRSVSLASITSPPPPIANSPVLRCKLESYRLGTAASPPLSPHSSM